MNDFLFFTIVSKIYLVAFMMFVFSGIIRDIFIKVEPKMQTIETQKNVQKLSLRESIRAILAVVFLVIIFIYFLKTNMQLLTIVLSVFLFPIFFLAFIYSIYIFLRFLFLKPIDFEFKSIHESAIGLISYVSLGLFGYVNRLCSNGNLQIFLNSLTSFFHDLCLMLIIPFWYFISVFLILTLFFLSILKVYELFMSYKKNSKSNKFRDNDIKKEIGHFVLSGFISKWIGETPKGRFFRFAVLYILWAPLILIDAVIEFFRYCTEQLITFFLILFRFFNYLRKYISKILGDATNNKGRVIIIISRISIIFSFIFTYLIDAYKKLFSPAGSRLFEFFCGVMIIPLLITQIIDIKKKSESLKNSN